MHPMRSIRHAVVPLVALASALPAQQRQGFTFVEATIADVHAAITRRATTCRAIVAGYLARIERYDKQGPAINAIVVVNPTALTIADSLDRRFAATRTLVGPMHCVPVIVKD